MNQPLVTPFNPTASSPGLSPRAAADPFAFNGAQAFGQAPGLDAFMAQNLAQVLVGVLRAISQMQNGAAMNGPMGPAGAPINQAPTGPQPPAMTAPQANLPTPGPAAAPAGPQLGGPVQMTRAPAPQGAAAQPQAPAPKPGLAGQGKVNLPADVAQQIRGAKDDADGARVLKDYLTKETGAKNDREVLNKLPGSKIKKGKNKDRESSKMLDRLLKEKVTQVRQQGAGQPQAAGAAGPTPMAPQGLHTTPAGASPNPYFCPPGSSPVNSSSPVSSASSSSSSPVSLDFSSSENSKEADKISDMGSPLSLDTNRDGRFTSTHKTQFDVDADGRADQVNDVDPNDLLLTFDKNKDGVAGKDGSELLGDNTDLNNDGQKDGFKDGFAALEAMAAKYTKGDGTSFAADGKLDADELRHLEQHEGLKSRQGGLNGRDVSFAEAGIQEIKLGTGEAQRTRNFDGQGNDLSRRQGAGFTQVDANGQVNQGEMADIWFQLGQ